MTLPEDQGLCRRLEREYGVARVLLAGRASLGLMAVLRSWVNAGHAASVALSAMVCHDVVAAVLGAGCEPVFCDIDPVSGKVPHSEWMRAREAGASVALVVHLYGNPADLSEARACFPSPDCLLIDDAAQALGSRNAAGEVGGQGDVGLLSFGATKHIDVGGAAMLFRDADLAGDVALVLASIPITPEIQRTAILARFRQGFDAARKRLWDEGDAAATAFQGLLDGYTPALQVPLPSGTGRTIVAALDGYAEERAQRILKAAAWNRGLIACGLIPVGMGEGTVPWRYTCRLPGIDWRSQHDLGQEMRGHGLHVSHWYLPAHWMCGCDQQTLPGVERLSQEVFQFWVDKQTSMQTIEHGIEVVTSVIDEYNSNAEGIWGRRS